jgi:nitrogen fixation protein FixH
MKKNTPPKRLAQFNGIAHQPVLDGRQDEATRRLHHDGGNGVASRNDLGVTIAAERGEPHKGPPVRSRFWPWPGMVFVLLAGNMAIVSTMIYAATSDKSFSVEPDYYRKAVEWDRSATQRAHNAALGCNVSVAPAPVGAPIAARLVDDQGQAIRGADVEVVAFHNARASNRLETTLEEIEPGLYRSTEVLMRPGLWELRFTIKIGGEAFTQSVTHVVQEGQP